MHNSLLPYRMQIKIATSCFKDVANKSMGRIFAYRVKTKNIKIEKTKRSVQFQ